MKKSFWNILAILISAELVLQIISYGRYLHSIQTYTDTKITTNWYTKLPASAWWNTEKNSLVPVYHPFLGFIFKNIQTSNIHIDEFGVRHTSNNTPIASDAYKTIYLFGGSAMTGYGVKDAETIPSYLGKHLNTPVFRYKLFNYGQIRYNSNQELQLFVSQLKNGHVPDLVIFYDGFNDAVLTLKTSENNELNNIVSEKKYAEKIGSLSTLFLSDIENTSLINIQTLQEVGELLYTRIKLIDYPIQIAIRLRQILMPGETSTTHEISEEKIQKTVNNYVANASMIHELSQQYHFKYLLVWQPLPQYKQLTQEEREDTEISHHPDNVGLIDTITKELHTRNIEHFYDLSHSFDAYENTSIFMDSIHISPQGNEIVASTLARLIESEMQ